MAKRNIRQDGDDILRKISKPVTDFGPKLWQLLDDMAETMEAHNGVGLAAVQVGVLRRCFVVDAGEGLIECVNPRVLETSGSQTVLEGCLSYPGQWGEVTRPDRVTLEAQDRTGEWFQVEAQGLLAQALVHENDHLDGIIFKDNNCRMLTDQEVEKLLREQE